LAFINLSQQPIQHQRFYQRTINLTNIRFTKGEQTVLDYGLQYSLEKPLKTYWMNLIIETERARPVPTQTWLRAVTTCVCKPEAANTVGAADDERRAARNMLSF